MAAGDATRASNIDPLALFDDEATRHDAGHDPDGLYSGDSATGSIDLGPRDQSLRYARLPEEDATRMSDVDALVAKERERARAGRPAPARPPPPSPSSVHDEATRAVDIGRTASISDVDWDLD
jgi:hypothetical protein